MKKITKKTITRYHNITSYVCDGCGEKQMDADLIFNCPVHGEFCVDCTIFIEPCFKLCPECKVTSKELLDDAIYRFSKKVLFIISGFKNIPFEIIGDRFDYLIVGKNEKET